MSQKSEYFPSLVSVWFDAIPRHRAATLFRDLESDGKVDEVLATSEVLAREINENKHENINYLRGVLWHPIGQQLICLNRCRDG